jgi:hypothetical protein
MHHRLLGALTAVNARSNRLASGEEIIETARDEMKQRFARGTAITSLEKPKEFLQLTLGRLE